MIRIPLYTLLLATLLPTAHAEDFMPRARSGDARQAAARPAPLGAPVTPEQVGDAGSFGRDMHWLGLLDGNVNLAQDCSGAAGACQVLAPGGFTTFDFADLGSVALPARSTHSLICHWQTPIVFYSAHNPGGAPQEFNFRVTPYYTIESEVLDGPSDPNTGVPYGGEIELPLTGIFTAQTLAPGASISDVATGTRACIGGLVSAQSLQSQWGLTAAQADDFFRGPVTIRMGIRGNAQMLEDASIYIGTRFVGD
jgi:hypothetical protein